MDFDFWLPLALVVAALMLVAAIIGTDVYTSHLIAKSADPVATACALGKKQACLILATRRP